MQATQVSLRLLFLVLAVAGAVHLLCTGGRRQPQRPPLLLVHGFGASTSLAQKYAELATILKFGQLTYWDLDVQLNLTGSSGDLWRDQLYVSLKSLISQLYCGQLAGVCVVCCCQRPDAAAGLVLLNSAGPFSENQPSEPESLQTEDLNS